MTTNNVIALVKALSLGLAIGGASGVGYLYAKGKYEPDAIKLKARVDSVSIQLTAANVRVEQLSKEADSITKENDSIIKNVHTKIDTAWLRLEKAALPVNTRPEIDSIKAYYAQEEHSYNSIILIKDSLITTLRVLNTTKDSMIVGLTAENTALRLQVDQLNAKLQRQGKLTKILAVTSAIGLGYAIIRR